MPQRTIESPMASENLSNQLNRIVQVSLSASEVRELISKRAYDLYKLRGEHFGDELSDWLNAEGEVVRMLLTEPPQMFETEIPNGQVAPRTGTAISVTADSARPRVSRWSKRKRTLKGSRP